VTTLRDVLTAPFLFRGETVPGEDGSWVRTLSYPELDCVVRGDVVLDLLAELEVERVKCLVRRVEAGAPIRPLREPIESDGVEALLTRAGLADRIARLDEAVPLGRPEPPHAVALPEEEP
jgi:hypothetical protein